MKITIVFDFDTTAVSFKDTPLRAGKRVFTGNPLRPSLMKSTRDEARRFFGLDEAFTLSVIGGSQGSRRINMEFMEAVFKGLIPANPETKRIKGRKS